MMKYENIPRDVVLHYKKFKTGGSSIGDPVDPVGPAEFTLQKIGKGYINTRLMPCENNPDSVLCTDPRWLFHLQELEKLDDIADTKGNKQKDTENNLPNVEKFENYEIVWIKGLTDSEKESYFSDLKTIRSNKDKRSISSNYTMS